MEDEEESVALRRVREYREQRDSMAEGEAAENDVKDDGGLLLEAADRGELDVVKYLVEEVGASVEVQDEEHMFPLHLAAGKGHLLVMEYLVAHGNAAVEAEGGDDATALYLAAQNGHLAVVEYLVLEAGADLEAETWWHEVRPLYAAVEGQHLPVVQFLLEHGACTDTESASGDRPLHAAAECEQLPIIQALLQQRAGSIDVNAQNHEGKTALHLAACAEGLPFTPEEERVQEVVRLLVEEGEADPLLRDKRGSRASDLARTEGYDQVECYLLEAEEMAEMQKQA